MKHAFQFLDVEGTGQLSVDELIGNGEESKGPFGSRCYNAAAHPRVRTREKLEENVHKEFADGIKARAPDGVVDENIFIEFYADLNACLPAEKDEYFIDMVLKTWNLNQEVYISPKRISELETIVYEKVRQRTHGSEDEGRTMRKVFKKFDLNDSGCISFSEFIKALEAYGCVFKEAEMTALF